MSAPVDPKAAEMWIAGLGMALVEMKDSEIAALRAENERLRAALMAELADHEEAIAHDRGGLEYASLVGIPLSNADSLAQSVRYHESRAKLIRAALEERP